ncbi:MAG: hypothetical protein R2754_10205 [Microthrixaceae bacterium]
MSTETALARARMLASETSLSAIPELRIRVSKRLADLAASPEATRAHRLAQEISALLDHAEDLDDEQRALLRGAVEYFVLEDDFEPGLLDDAEVVRSVREALGLTDVPDLLASDAAEPHRQPAPAALPADDEALEFIEEDRDEVFGDSPEL